MFLPETGFDEILEKEEAQRKACNLRAEIEPLKSQFLEELRKYMGPSTEVSLVIHDKAIDMNRLTLKLLKKYKKICSVS